MKKYIKGMISLIILFAIIVLLVFLTIKQYKDDHIEPDLGDFGLVLLSLLATVSIITLVLEKYFLILEN